MKPGETTEIAGYSIAFNGVSPRPGPNYQDQVGQFAVTRSGKPVTIIESSRLLYASYTAELDA